MLKLLLGMNEKRRRRRRRKSFLIKRKRLIRMFLNVFSKIIEMVSKDFMISRKMLRRYII